MLKELDKKIKLDILITIIATFISINFIIFLIFLKIILQKFCLF
jgi:hypothetical protein